MWFFLVFTANCNYHGPYCIHFCFDLARSFLLFRRGCRRRFFHFKIGFLCCHRSNAIKRSNSVARQQQLIQIGQKQNKSQTRSTKKSSLTNFFLPLFAKKTCSFSTSSGVEYRFDQYDGLNNLSCDSMSSNRMAIFVPHTNVPLSHAGNVTQVFRSKPD